MLDETCRNLIETWPLGFVATINADGTPNLSPKGTFVVHDEKTVAFAAIRSPRTLANLAERPDVSVNFCDVLSRRAVCLSGVAQIITVEDPDFPRLASPHNAAWPDFDGRIKAIVLIEVAKSSAITSPIHDNEVNEEELRAAWMSTIKNNYIKHRFAEKREC